MTADTLRAAARAALESAQPKSGRQPCTADLELRLQQVLYCNFETNILRYVESSETISALIKMCQRFVRYSEPASQVHRLSAELLSRFCNNSRLREVLLAHSPDIVEHVAGLTLRADKDSQLSLYLHWLKMLTFHYRCGVPNNVIGELLEYLVGNISSPRQSQLSLNAAILANLLYNNLLVQARVKTMESIQRLYKSLINMLSHKDISVIVYSLSALTSLALRDSLGEKLFNKENMDQTFELIFNIVTQQSTDCIDLVPYCVDLITDLMSKEGVLQSLGDYGGLEDSLSRLLDNLDTGAADDYVPSILELMKELLVKGGDVAGKICTVCMKKQAPFHTLLDLVLMARQDIAATAADVVKMLFAQPTSKVLAQLLSESDGTLESVGRMVSYATGEESRGGVERARTVLSTLSVIFSESSLRKLLTSKVKTREWLEHALALVRDGDGDVALLVCDILFKDGAIERDWQAAHHVILQPAFMRCLAESLHSSESKDGIQTSVMLLFNILRSSHHRDLDLLTVTDALYEVNAAMSSGQVNSSYVDTSSAGLVVSATEGDKDTIARLEKEVAVLRESRDGDHGSSSRWSHAATGSGTGELLKEIDHLKGLLDAKDEALENADRLLNESRQRRTAVDTQLASATAKVEELEGKLADHARTLNQHMEKIHRMTVDAEQKEDEVRHMELDLEKANQDLRKANEEIRRLRPLSDEQSDRLEEVYGKLILLTKSYEVKCHEYEDICRKHEAMVDDHEGLKKGSKEYKAQASELRSKCNMLEQSVISLEGQLIEKRSDLESANTQCDILREQVGSLEERLLEKESSARTLRQELSLSDVKLKEAERKAELKEEELRKFASVTSMIHNLTLQQGVLADSSTTVPALNGSPQK